MKRLDILVTGVIILCGLIIGGGFFFHGAYLWGLLALFMGGFWIVGWKRQWKVTHFLSFFLLTALAIVGLWQKFGVFFFLVGELFNIAAWDLTYFHQQVSRIQEHESTTPFLVKHLRHLIPILILGGVLSFVAINFQIQLNFLTVLFLGAIMILSLNALIKFGKRVR